jgi:DNA polymerase III subunit delta'
MPWNLVGNKRAIRALEAAVRGGTPPQAYLFSGPEHTGRTTAARRLAQALNCTGDSPPCLECNQCRRIESGVHSGVLMITLENEEGRARKNISTDQLRALIEAVSHTSFEGRMRVAIIDPAEIMSEEAQNTFLKTLEEPPANATFVLIAADEQPLLETILSRCTRVDFGLVAADEIEAALIDRASNKDDARLLARLSGGRPGWAIAAASDPRVLERRREAIETARSLARLPMADRMDLSERLSDAFKRDREPVLAQVDQWAAWWRDVLLVQSGASERAANLDMERELREDAEGHTTAEIAAFLQALIETRTYLVENVQSRIALDALMLAAP